MPDANDQSETSSAPIPSAASEALYEAASPPAIHRGLVGRFLKRTLDIVASVTLLVVLSPQLALAILVIRVGSSGESFFRLDRAGIHGRHFTPPSSSGPW
jgi:lipopolysaccharide/colanic/teichoic acid biosynthesis glycosyltransferase